MIKSVGSINSINRTFLSIGLHQNLAELISKCLHKAFYSMQELNIFSHLHLWEYRIALILKLKQAPQKCIGSYFCSNFTQLYKLVICSVYFDLFPRDYQKNKQDF